MHNELPQGAPANYETIQQLRDHPPATHDDNKLGSARPDNDFLDGVANDAGTVPAEFIAPDVRPRAVLPREGIPPETQATDFITPESRPRELRPREFYYREGL